MNLNINLRDILFLDIETVPEVANFKELSEEKQELFALKTAYQRSKDENEISPEDFYDNAGIWAEFGKIICISVGYLNIKKQEKEFRTRSFIGEEKKLLVEFSVFLTRYFNEPKHLLCAHNGKEFDFPYIARRMVIQQVALPKILNLFGRKPWEVQHLDTMELWKFGDYKHYTSIKLLTEILGIPSPKDDIDGSMVRHTYYNEQAIEKIKIYCEKDVVAVVQILLRLNNEPILKKEQIVNT